MPLGELLFVIALVGSFLIPSAYFAITVNKKLWWLFGIFAIFFACFGIMEGIAVATQGQSISQMVWEVDANHPGAIWIVSCLPLIGWGALIMHFKFHKKK